MPQPTTPPEAASTKTTSRQPSAAGVTLWHDAPPSVVYTISPLSCPAHACWPSTLSNPCVTPAPPLWMEFHVAPPSIEREITPFSPARNTVLASAYSTSHRRWLLPG